MTSKPEANPVRTRNVGVLHLGDDAIVAVDHVYLPEGAAGTCDHDGCGSPAHDPGDVGLMVSDEDGDTASVLMHPYQALALANRLTRAANFALESGEDGPDLEREAARWNSEREAKS